MGRSPGYCSNFVQAVVIITLFIVFLQFFGLSTFAKWGRQDVQIVRRKEPRNSLPPPAITICAITKEFHGWNLSSPRDELLRNCEGQEDIEDCVRKNTFALKDVVVLNGSSILNYKEDKNDLEDDEELINSSLWKSRMTETDNGMCHTLIYDKHIGKRTYLQIGLHLNITSVFLHDPKFFVFKDTNVFIPFLKLTDVFNKEFTILATTKKRMKRKSKFDCNPDENYNFGDCVRQKIVEREGCQTPWDLRTSDNLPKCSDRSSIKAFDSYYHQVFFASENKLKELTGCLVPCIYTHYSLSDSYSLQSNETEFVIRHALTDLIIEEEVLLFPFDSLVSEFGGALGLFLGFSFLGAALMLQEWIVAIISMFKRVDDADVGGGQHLHVQEQQK